VFKKFSNHTNKQIIKLSLACNKKYTCFKSHFQNKKKKHYLFNKLHQNQVAISYHVISWWWLDQ